MMEGNENSIDDFAFDLLRRAKERTQVISTKGSRPETQNKEDIEEMMQKLEQKTSSSSVVMSEKALSPAKQVSRPILKHISDNDRDSIDVLQERPPAQKKSVITCDEITGNTIVEANTFISDETAFEVDDDDESYEQNANMSDDIAISEGEEKAAEVHTTPNLSRGLKKLSDFHSKEEVDSPVHSHNPLETFNHGHEDEEEIVYVSASRHARTSRLSALAKTINAWEDDTTHHSIPGSRFVEASINKRPSLAGKSKFSTSKASSPSASSPLSLGPKGQICGELQGFSRKQSSPLRQIREKSPPHSETSDDERPPSRRPLSPKKTYFGGSPSKNITSNGDSSQNTPLRSPVKPTSSVGQPKSHCSPSKSVSPVRHNAHQFVSPVRQSTENVARKSISPVKAISPPKPVRNSPIKPVEKLSSNESTPTAKPVSAIRKKFEGNVRSGPPKPERSHFNHYYTPNSKPTPTSTKKVGSPVKKFHFGETEKDPSLLSVAERAKLFEGSNFFVAAKKPVVVDVQPKVPIFTSSPCVENVQLQEIDVSSVVPAASLQMEPHFRSVVTPVKQTVPGSVSSSCLPPPPPPPMPTNTSTPTASGSAKRRSTSPVRSFPLENHSVKRIKVNAPKVGNMYPSLTDIETETETETEGHCSEVESMDDSIESQQSLGQHIETIAKSCSPIRSDYPVVGRVHPRYRPSEDFSATFACAEVDALIDEALEGQLDGITMDSSTAFYEAEKTVIYASPSPPPKASALYDSEEGFDKGEQVNSEVPLDEASYSEADTTASSSFTSSPVTLSNYSALSAAKNFDAQKTLQTDFPQNNDYGYQAPQPPAGRFCNDEEIQAPRQLVHTVSFYRKQQQQQKKVETCCSLNEISEQNESSEDSMEEGTTSKPSITEMIRKLEEEVESHNLAIVQASKALNLCKQLIAFSDSTENIECERILLIETQKRLALLNSIHRLKTDGALSQRMSVVFSPSKQEVTPNSKGNMKISDISITLRKEFFNARRAEHQYHFICLLRNKHQIEHTALITYDSQKQGSSLKFANEFQLRSLDPDFQVILDIYFLESTKEFIPHEAKYRINAKRDSKQAALLSPLLTPSKKAGKGDASKNLLTRPQIHSPAGPDTIKSSSFKFCGNLTIDISSLQRTYWELDKVSGPLTGGVSISIQCSAMGGVEHKGFLTLFEDVSGYGAWVRRWCRLGPTSLEFWKYPEDESEGKKPPLGTLNLHECVTSKVRPAPRDVCARANTILLVTTRAPHPNDKDTLVTSCHKGYTAVRHLISADMREERDIWCHQLNKALANLRAWDPVAKQAVDDNLF